MKSKKTKNDWKYDIQEIIGISSPEANLSGDWHKEILNEIFGIEPSNSDHNKVASIVNKGIHISEEEATLLVDALLRNGYGSIDVLESEYHKRLEDRRV